jgi:two-component system response regulator YesN
LPGIDGLEFFKRVQSSYPEALKIIITAYKDQSVISEASKIGINNFIEKPFSIQSLEKALSWLLKQRDPNKNSDLRHLTKQN